MTNTNDLTLSLKASELDNNEINYSVVATKEQRAALVERFGLVDLAELSGEVSVKRKEAIEGIFLEGSIKAVLTQACTISLKPVAETVDEEFALVLVSPETADRMDEDEAYLDASSPDYDALEGDDVEIGEVIAQTLAISMNQYPRADDVDLAAIANDKISVNEAELEKPNPFAALSKLKDQS